MFSGSLVAIVTPMIEDGALDWAAWDRLLDFHVAEGSNGIVIAGTTGESPVLSLEEIEEVVIRDRKHLSEDGVVVPIIAINKHTGQIESQPEIVTRGFMPSDNVPELINGAREVVLRTVEQSNDEEKTDWSVIKEKVRSDLKRYLNKQTAKRPLILPVILEV